MKRYIFLLPIIFAMTNSCGGNLYNEISSKDSANALFIDAKNAINDLDYTTAINKILSIESSNPEFYNSCATADGVRKCPREVLAGAYAGRCGFGLLSFIASIGSSSGAVFSFLMNTFTDITVNPDDCYQAQLVIESIGSPTELNSDQKIFMALLGMAKIGVYLRNDADADQDGVTDATFDACNSASISDVNVKQVITGLGLFLTYSAALSTTGSATDDLSDISAACGASCNITDPTNPSLDATVVDSFRMITASLQYGVGTCDPLPTCCP